MKIIKLLTIFVILLLAISTASAAYNGSHGKNKHTDHKHCKNCVSSNTGCKQCKDNSKSNKPVDNSKASKTASGASSNAPSWINLKNNPDAKDPTYKELVSFIKADKTDRKSYVPGSYMCDSFAEDVHNNAEKAGIKAGFVELKLSNPDDMQYCNVFNTVDKGTVYIDCTGEERGGVNCDTTVKEIKTGIRYHPVALYPPSERAYYQGTIKSFKIFW